MCCRNSAAKSKRRLSICSKVRRQIAVSRKGAIWRQTFEHLDNRRFDFAALLRQHTEFLLRGLAADEKGE